VEKDPFDEFEFKPINEGIGFHKKTAQFKKSLDVTQSMPSVSLPLKQPLKAEAPQPARLQTPAPKLPLHDFIDRPKWNDAPKGAPRSTIAPQSSRGSTPISPPANEMRTPLTTPAPARAPIAKAALGTLRSETMSKPREEIRSVSRSAHKYEDSNVFIPAIIFDTIVVIGLTCLFAVAVLLVVDVDLLNIIQSASGDFMTSLSLILLCLSVLELYLIIFRSFLGATLGEWAFDIQLGTKAEQASAYYPLRVIWRSMVVIGTGFITLPILSLLAGKDLAGFITGLSLKNGDPIG
jgi:hypothetical protein